jgi:hypothetical protein
MNDTLKKDLNDVRRQLAESNCEKDKYDLTNKELREQIKRAEGDKRDGGRVLEESFQKISSKYIITESVYLMTPHFKSSRGLENELGSGQNSYATAAA